MNTLTVAKATRNKHMVLSLESFYNMFNNLEKACQSYCRNTLYKELEISPSFLSYTCFKLTKERDEIVICINYGHRTDCGISYGVKRLPLNDIIALALTL